MKEKKKEIGDKAAKLKGGLLKLDETGKQVGEMQVVCEDKRRVVAKAKVDCEELLVEIVQDKRVADEQEKQVNAEATKIAKEAEQANAIAAECQEGLNKALPALERLILNNNQIADAGLAALAEAAAKPGALPALKYLPLAGNQITDAGAGSLARALEAGALPALEFLSLPASLKGNADLERVKASRAGLRIIYP